MFINCDNLDVVDYLRSGALILAFVAVFVADRKSRSEGSVWIKGDVISMAALGAGWYLFPSQILAYMSNAKSDILHEFMLRQSGAILLGLALMWRHFSEDRTVPSAWMLTRTWACLTGLLFLVHGQIHLAGQKTHMTDQNVTFNMLVSLLMVIGNLYHLLKRGSFGSVRRSWSTSDPMTVHLLIDVITILPVALAMFALPGTFASVMDFKGIKADEIHLLVIRNHGLMIVSSRIFNMLALGFTNEGDRRAVFKAHLWAVLFIMPWSVYIISQHSLYTKPAYAAVMLYAMIPLLNSLIAAKCLPSPAKLFSSKRA